MTTDKALLVRDDSKLSVAFTVEAIVLQQAALASAGLIGRVSSAEEQELAVNAQMELTRVSKLVEASRKQAKEPVIIYGRAIDDAAKEFVKEIKEEEVRIVTLVSNFQALEMAKVRAAQAAENERLLAVERERAAALAAATSHDDFDNINSEFNQRIADEAKAPIAPARVEGQSVVEAWDFEVLDVWALAAAHPTCVKPPEPRRNEIKALLDSGVKVTGIKAWKAVKAGVRLAREPKAITV